MIKKTRQPRTRINVKEVREPRHSKKGGKKHAPKKKDAEALDRDLANYWIKKGDTENAKAHLDVELDDYWRKEAKTHKLDEQVLITEDTAVNSQIHS